MSNIENIKNTILAEAQVEADAILEQASGESREFLDSVRREVEAEIARAKEYATNRAASLTEQIDAAAHLEARDKVLGAQQNLISQVISEAKQRLLNISDAELEALIKHKLAGRQLSEGEVLVLPKGRNIKLDQDVPVEYDDNLTVGFALRKGGVREKYDFCEILDYSRDELEHMILKLITEGK